jgi:hypothetical protein
VPPQNIGLYYPYIHFRDSAWLKRATLYWDKLARIVPEADDVNAEDTDLVRELKHDSDFIEDLRPTHQTNKVGRRFLRLMQTHERELRSKYGLARWEGRLIGTHPYKRRHVGDDLVAEVYSEKLSNRLREALVETQLAYSPPYANHLLMHRKLAGVYMTVLADAMAGKVYQPTTDHIRNHFAVMGGNMQHIKEVLLPSKSKCHAGMKTLDTSRVAMFAIQMAVPKNIEAVSVKDLLRFRKSYKDEVAEFRKDVTSFVHDHQVMSSFVSRPQDLQRALEEAYHNKLEKKLNEVDAIVRKTWHETAFAMLYVSPMALVGKAIPTFFGLEEPISTTIAAIALAGIPVVRQKRKELKSQIGPAAYLLHAKESFAPTSTRTVSFKKWTRNFFFRM